MKSFTFVFLLFVVTQSALAQSTAYELQATKINNLLTERAGKFDQYQTSLTQRTGIFGLKTKKDMQRSIDILTDIVTNDNKILKETKVLLDYKDFEKSQVESKATDVEGRMNGYMTTITKLQQQNSELSEALDKADKQQSTYLYIMIGISLILLVALVMAKRKR